MEPKKSLGQHWLYDETSLDAMIEAGHVSPEDVVLEVGPGLGTLTKKLCSKVKNVIAVEVDNSLIQKLKENISKNEDSARANNLVVVNQSILDFDTSSLPKGYKVIANIPYYLTSNLIRRMLESHNPPSRMVLLVQKEVAERVSAGPGQMGILSVATQFYAEVELSAVIPARLFTPPPKVDSQILVIKRRTTPLFADIQPEDFFKIVRAGFSEKRKKLRSSLSGSLHQTKTDVDSWLARASVAPNARAQELTLTDWYKLTKYATL